MKTLRVVKIKDYNGTCDGCKLPTPQSAIRILVNHLRQNGYY